MKFSNDRLTGLAVTDLLDGLRATSVWGMLGWQDIKQRYRRSLLGPLWLTLSTAVMVGALGFVYAAIFKISLRDYFPFLAVGLVVWTLLSNTIIDACQVFIGAEGAIKQIRLPFALHACRMLWRNAIILAHNAIIIVVVVAFFGKPVIAQTVLLAVPGLALIALNLLWVTLFLGTICARYRDVPPIVGSLLQVAFFLTPILWNPALLPGRQRIVDWNPLYHFMEVVRAPLLGQAPTAENWTFVIAVTLLGWVATFVLFRRYRGRIAYWV